MIKINKEQYEALQSFLNTQRGLKNQLGAMSKMHGHWEGNWKPLNDIPFEDFAELLVMGKYEVKRTVEDVLEDFIDASRGKLEPSEGALRRLKQTLQKEGLI